MLITDAIFFLATLFTDGAITAATAGSVKREGNAPPDCRSALSIDTEPHAVNLHSIITASAGAAKHEDNSQPGRCATLSIATATATAPLQVR